jgi:hypothetical protein
VRAESRASGGRRRLALEGALLFAFIPAVLVLYLQQPLGPAPSLGLGVVVMLGHRFIAAPWMARHAGERCLWCGLGVAEPDPAIEVAASGGVLRLRACGEAHRERIGRLFTFVSRYRIPIALGIFVPLFILLAGTLMIVVGRPVIALEMNRLQFRLIVAITVLATSLAYLGAGSTDASLSCPFPLHNLFLLGVRNTLWVFRVVGVWWLILSALALAGR